MFRLERLNLLVTKRCNIHCRMCDYRLTSYFVKELTLEKIQNLISVATSAGLKQLELSGGEPLMRKEIYEIISYASSLGLKIMMMTNGLLIDERKAKMLIDAGLTGVVVSLEGFESMNDTIRGVGNYKKAVNAIRCFQKYSDDIDFIKVGVTISRYNYNILYDFTSFLFEELKIDAISYNPFNKDMLLKKNYNNRNTEFDISESEIGILESEIVRIINYSKNGKGEFPPIEFLSNIPNYFRGKNMTPKNGCMNLEYGCCIDSNGSVYLCWGESIIVGNINDESLIDILMSEKSFKIRQLAREGKCNGCLSACYADVHS